MPYERRSGAGTAERFDTAKEAIEAAKRLLRGDPNAEPEIIDLSTGSEPELAGGAPQPRRLLTAAAPVPRPHVRTRGPVNAATSSSPGKTAAVRRDAP